jgi:glucokinase
VNELIIGVDLGGTNVKSALITREREVLSKDVRPTKAEEGLETVLDVIEASVRDLLQAQDLNFDSILAMGMGAPGPMDWQTGVVYSPPNLPGWENVPLAKEMNTRLGLPVYVDNDANVACYGEYWMGAGQGTNNMAVLTLGTGVGGGVVVFGKLLRGIDGTAAELGHLKVQRDGRPCGCGSKGCLESYASVSGMVQTALELLEASSAPSLLSELCEGDTSRITGRMISKAADEGDVLAKKVFEETATWLGLGIASIVHYQNPEKVVLCGGMIAAGDLLFEPVRRVVLENTFEVPGKRCQIVPAGLGADAGVIGAAGCALSRFTEDN